MKMINQVIDAMQMALDALEIATTPLRKDRQEVLRARNALMDAITTINEHMGHESCHRAFIEIATNGYSDLRLPDFEEGWNAACDYKEKKYMSKVFEKISDKKSIAKSSFEEFAAIFDTESRRWQDMGADEYFKAGFAYGLSELQKLEEKNKMMVFAIEAAIDCGMVPSTSAKEGGAAKHSIQVHVADQLREALACAKGQK